MDPFSWIFIGLTAAASLMQGVSSYLAGEEQAKNLKEEAQRTEDVGQVNENIRKQKLRKMLARQTAEAGMGGTFSASTYAVLADTAQESEYQGSLDLYRTAAKAEQLRREAQYAKRQGIFDLSQGILSAGASAGLGFSKWFNTRIPGAGLDQGFNIESGIPGKNWLAGKNFTAGFPKKVW